jgi:hypothetical protein
VWQVWLAEMPQGAAQSCQNACNGIVGFNSPLRGNRDLLHIAIDVHRDVITAWWSGEWVSMVAPVTWTSQSVTVHRNLLAGLAAAFAAHVTGASR